MEIRKIVLGKIIEILRIIGEDNFNIVKVYNDYKKHTLTVLYTNNKLEEVEKELCCYGERPFTKGEIYELNRYIRHLNNTTEYLTKLDLKHLNIINKIRWERIETMTKDIETLRKVLIFLCVAFFVMNIINMF